jgi:hypothetical protein
MQRRQDDYDITPDAAGAQRVAGQGEAEQVSRGFRCFGGGRALRAISTN